MISKRTNHLEELETRFSQLEARLQDTPEKEALSILHAIILENRTSQLSTSNTAGSSTQPTFEDVANL